MTNLSGALARRAQRWGHTRAGELASWIVLLAAVDGARRSAPTIELERAHAWAHAQLQHALDAVRFGTPSETAALDTSDVAATFATYARTIGELEPDRQSDAPKPAVFVQREPLTREFRAWVISWLARHLQLPASKIETGRSFADHGLDSVAAVELAKALSDKLGQPLDETLLWNFSTIDALVDHLVGKFREGPPASDGRSASALTEAPPAAQRPSSAGGPAPSSGALEAELDDELARLERELRSRS
jgi:acyl carrier protein